MGLRGGGGGCCCCEWRLGESGLMFVCYWIALLGCRLGEGATHREKERERENLSIREELYTRTVETT